MSRAEKRQRKKQNTQAARQAREAALKRQKRKSVALRVGAAVLVVAIAVGIGTLVTAGDGGDDDTADATTTLPSETTTTVAPQLSDPEVELDPAVVYTATITTNKGDIVIEMATLDAPVGAARFIKLAREGFYDGLTWHRASSDFVIQGGDPQGDGTGGTGTPVVAETPTDNYPIGSLAAAKSAADPPGSFDSQFFVVTGENGGTLPNEYARFGMVTSGIEVAQEIEALAPDSGDGPPTEAATIEKVVITESPREEAPAPTAAP